MRKIYCWAHPKAIILLSVLSLAGGFFSAYYISLWKERDYPFLSVNGQVPDELLWMNVIYGNPWLALAVGMGTGLPGVLVAKAMLRMSVDESDRSVTVTSRGNIYCTIPLIAGLVLAVVATWLLGISLFPAAFGTFVSAFLLYPDARSSHKVKMRFEKADQCGGSTTCDKASGR